jgi:hypothetical protein
VQGDGHDRADSSGDQTLGSNRHRNRLSQLFIRGEKAILPFCLHGFALVSCSYRHIE